ncbi:MAG: glycosyltransferase family 39 protein [Anaerolineales bacterium]|nr:MAG: glycosyltransferase family 39 protein [Anaerolineales bacterium]
MKGILILLLTAVAFALRLAYLLHSHPFIDEFTTVLAARAILQSGLPVLPSGLFYEHGLLFSYLDAPFLALAGERSQFAVARIPSLIIGTATVPLLYWVGQRWLSARAGLVAAALLAFSPEGVVWGGRARMYALAQLLVLLLALLVYQGSRGEDSARKVRWLALAALLGALLTQLGALILVPPLLIGALVVGWSTRPAGVRPWFLRRGVLVEGAALAAVIGLSVLVKRLGQPLGAAPLGSSGVGGLLEELIGTVTYQTGLAWDGESAVKFLARQFGVPHHLWLTIIAVAGGLLWLTVWLLSRKSSKQQVSGTFVSASQSGNSPSSPSALQSHSFLLYLWLVFGLSVIEMLLLLEPWRRNPRYLVMALPLFYLIVTGSLGQISKIRPQISSAILPVFLVVQAGFLVPDLRIAYRTPEPAYEEAFQYVADQWQPGDVLLTINTSAASLFLGDRNHSSAGVYQFAIQEDARQFLLDVDTQPVDRWLGAPWVGTAADFNQVLNEHPRAWFVVDTIRLPVYYRGDWLAALASQMDLVWSEDNALVYLTRPDRVPVPTGPDVALSARFGDIIVLNGYSIARNYDYLTEAQVGPCQADQVLCFKPDDRLHLTFFWQALAPVMADYTVFLHLRDERGVTVAQQDSQPFDGLYPTSQWRPGETIAQPLTVDLPPDLPFGAYSLHVGLYRLDTMTRLSIDQDASGENAFTLDQTILVVSGE